MKLKARLEDEAYTFQDLHSTFDRNDHKNKEDFETSECGCLWWKCTHCAHKTPDGRFMYRNMCMICEDPFSRI